MKGMKTWILVLCALLCLATVSISDNREQDRVEGKIYRDLHRMVGYEDITRKVWIKEKAGGFLAYIVSSLYTRGLQQG